MAFSFSCTLQHTHGVSGTGIGDFCVRMIIQFRFGRKAICSNIYRTNYVQKQIPMAIMFRKKFVQFDLLNYDIHYSSVRIAYFVLWANEDSITSVVTKWHYTQQIVWNGCRFEGYHAWKPLLLLFSVWFLIEAYCHNLCAELFIVGKILNGLKWFLILLFPITLLFIYRLMNTTRAQNPMAW